MRLGRYETLVRLGRGGMAEVFAARLSGEAGFAKLVAVKRMLAHLSTDPALVARFHDEARLAAHVTSPHVVQTLDVGRGEDGQPFLVLELVLGVSLAHLLAQRPLPSLSVRLELVTQAALGLADVHEARAPDGTPLEIVHRDVSPHNILVGSDGRARLADFGIARANVPREETRTGVVLGKWGYMAPEQIRCGPLDARTDVYAMGAVAWEALTGRRLHGGSTPERVTERVLSGGLPSARDVEPELPASLARVVERALAKEPAERFASGRELAEALRAAGTALGPPVQQRTLVEEVRRAAGRSLSDLEAALAELPDDDGVSPRTITLTFEGASVSGLIGGDEETSEATLPDDFAEPARGGDIVPTQPNGGHTGFTPAPDRTVVEPRAPRRRSLRTVHVVALGLAAVAIGATVAGIATTMRDSPAAGAPPSAPAPATAADTSEIDPRPTRPATPALPPVEPAASSGDDSFIDSANESLDNMPIERTAARRRRPPRTPEDVAPSGPLLGTDRFDEAQR